MKHLLIILLLSQIALAAPDWLDANKREQEYPARDYITGYGENFDDIAGRAEKIESARNNARANLAKKIMVQVSSEYLGSITETNGELKEVTRLNVSSVTRLELAGMDVLLDYDDDTGRAFALAVLEKERAFNQALLRIERLRDQIDNGAQAAEHYESIGNRTRERQTWQMCLNLLEQLDEAFALAHIANLGDTWSYQQIEKATKAERSQKVNYAFIKQKIDSIWDREVDSIEDAAEILAGKLSAQLDAGERVLLGNLFYENTRFTSEFAERLKSYLHTKLNVDWKSGNAKFRPRSRAHSLESVRGAGADWVIEGRLLKKPHSMKVIVSAQRINGNGDFATADVEIPTRVIVQEGLHSKPKEYTRLIADAKVLDENELIPGDQSLEIWTDQGADGVVVHRGETIRFMVRVNQAGYLRLINVLNNGMKSPLYMNYHIREGMANKVVELPDEFECLPPFGHEMVLAYFSSQPFPDLPIVTRVVDGEEYQIIDESLKNFVAKTRGLKKVKKQDVTETRIPITTMR